MKRSALGILVLACVAAAPSAAKACSHTIKSIALNPNPACSGYQVVVTVVVDLDGKSYDVQKWFSTSIDGVCRDHGNHQSSSGLQEFTEAFTITAPGAQGIGNVQVKTFAADACSGGSLKQTENVKLTVVKCGVDCWDLNGNGACDLASEDTDGDGACGVHDCRGQDGQNGHDGQNGQNGQDCTIEQVEGGAQVCCGDECVTIFDGQNGTNGTNGTDGTNGTNGTDGTNGTNGTNGTDGTNGTNGTDGTDGTNGTNGTDGTNGTNGTNGTDGQNGTSCTASDNEDGSHTVTCGDTTVTLYGGIDCYDLNGNHQKDFCDPNGLAEFESCEDFLAYCASGEPLLDVQAKRRGVSLKVIDAVRMSSAFNCGFTEDTNGDGTIDAYDCQGSDGSNGTNGSNGSDGSNGSNGSSCTITNTATGAVIRCGDGTEVAILDGQNGTNGTNGTDGANGTNGTDGTNGANGADGLPCSVADNGDGTATITCADGTSATIGGPTGGPVGGGAPPPTPEPEPAPKGGLCGSFDGITFVGLLLPLFCAKRRNRR